MKRLTPAGSLILTQPRFRTSLEPDGKPFSTNFGLINISPGIYRVEGEFTLKNGIHYFYRYDGLVTLSYGLGITNNLQHVGPSLQPPWLGGKQFNRYWRPTSTEKRTTP